MSPSAATDRALAVVANRVEVSQSVPSDRFTASAARKTSPAPVSSIGVMVKVGTCTVAEASARSAPVSAVLISTRWAPERTRSAAARAGMSRQFDLHGRRDLGLGDDDVAGAECRQGGFDIGPCQMIVRPGGEQQRTVPALDELDGDEAGRRLGRRQHHR